MRRDSIIKRMLGALVGAILAVPVTIVAVVTVGLAVFAIPEPLGLDAESRVGYSQCAGLIILMSLPFGVILGAIVGAWRIDP